LTGAGKAGKAVMDFALSFLGKAGNFIKDGVSRFIENFPTVKVPEMGGVQSALGGVAGALGLDEKSKFIKKGKVGFVNLNLVTSLPDLSLLTPFGIGGLVSHLKNSLFPSGEKEQVTGSGSGAEDDFDIITGEDLKRTKEKMEKEEKINQARKDLEDGKITQEEFDKIFKENDGVKINPADLVASDDNSDAILDDSGESGGGTTPAKLEEADTSSTGTTVSDVSSQTTYEESTSGTVILGEPKRSDFGSGRSGASQYQQAMVMYSNQKEMLNSYFKTQVRASLYKI